VQKDQQKQLEGLSYVVAELAEDIRGWIKTGIEINSHVFEGQPTKVGRHRFGKQKKDDPPAKPTRSQSRGKVSKDVTPITRNQSPSPETKMRTRGNEFLEKIENLKKDL